MSPVFSEALLVPENIILQSAKILLLPPKGEIIFVTL